MLKKRFTFPAIFFCVSLIAAIGFFLLKNKNESPKSKPNESLTHVLVITLDTTRADMLGCYEYKRNTSPNIDALATDGILFKHVYSPVPLTLPSHCTIFTGTYPLFHGVRNNGNYLLSSQFNTMAEIFQEQGYRTSAFVSSFTVDSRFGLNQGFDHYDDRMTVQNTLEQMNSERIAEKTFDVFKEWMNNNYQSPFFCWLHFFDPHYPYEPPEPFNSEFNSNLYDGEIAYMDSYVGKAINLLKHMGVLKKTLIVIAGDHGEAFGEHKENGHQVFCYEENLKVPLIFYARNRFKNNLKVSQKVSLIDVFPTVLDVMGIHCPESVQGISLLPAINGKKLPERSLYFESYFAYEVLGCAPVTGILQEMYKLIDLPRLELYNLEEDPSEQNNIILKSGNVVKKLKKDLKDLVNRYKQEQIKSQRGITAKEREKLASLGYLTGSSKSRIKKKDLPDPKDKIDAFLEFSRADTLFQKGDLRKAESRLNKSLKMNSQFAPAYARLASLYSRQGKVKETVQLLDEAIKKLPGDFGLKIEYASLLFKLNRTQEALKFMDGFQKGCTVDLKVKMDLLYAQIYEYEKQIDKAISYYLNVVNIEPDNLPVNKKLLFLLTRANRLKETLPIYQRLEKLNPDDNNVIYRMAVIYGLTGDFEGSEKYFRKAFSKKHPPTLYFDYAIVQGLKKDLPNAIQYMKKFLSLVTTEHPRYKTAQNLINKYKDMLKIQ